MIKNIRGTNESIAYVCAVPHGCQRSTGVLFAHGGGSMRSGPHRMFVEIALHLNRLGYYTYRFDMRGCGDSEGTYSSSDMESGADDVGAMVKHFRQLTDIKKVVLFGISRGSYYSFKCALSGKASVDGMILLSMPFRTIATATRGATERLREYVRKAFTWQGFTKVIRGRVSVKRIVGTVAYAYELGREYDTRIARLVRKACPALFVYGDADPIAAPSWEQYSVLCRQHRIPCECVMFRNGNHSFTDYRWTPMIINVVCRWLTNPG